MDDWDDCKTDIEEYYLDKSGETQVRILINNCEEEAGSEQQQFANEHGLYLMNCNFDSNADIVDFKNDVLRRLMEHVNSCEMSDDSTF